jgi:hypothetical protein
MERHELRLVGVLVIVGMRMKFMLTNPVKRQNVKRGIMLVMKILKASKQNGMRNKRDDFRMNPQFFQEQRNQERKDFLNPIQDQDQNENKDRETSLSYVEEHDMNVIDGIDFDGNEEDQIRSNQIKSNQI